MEKKTNNASNNFLYKYDFQTQIVKEKIFQKKEKEKRLRINLYSQEKFVYLNIKCLKQSNSAN